MGNTFNKRLDEILDEVLIGMFCRDQDGNFVPLDDRHGVLRQEAKQAIRSLILEEVIGYDEIPAPLHHYENMEPKRVRNKFRSGQRSIVQENK